MTGAFITKKNFIIDISIFFCIIMLLVFLKLLQEKLFFRTSPQCLLSDCNVISCIENALVVKSFH